MKLSNLALVLRGAGLTVVETAGWATRGYDRQDLADIRGVLWHHTATNRNAYTYSDAPTLGMCMYGRSDLAGPLCNIVFGRDGTVYLVAAGVANHAGYGSAPNIPTDMGNHYLIGIEMESSGIAPWDWTEAQLRIAPILGATLERAYLLGLPEELRLQIAHYEYSSQGKIDPAGWPGNMDGLRASITIALNGGLAAQGSIEQDDFLMALPEERQLHIADSADRLLGVIPHPTNKLLTTADIPAIAAAFLDAKVDLPGGAGQTSPRVKFQYQKQEFNVLGAKLDAMIGLFASGTNGTITKDEIKAQLDASVKASFAEYEPTFAKKDAE